METKLKEIRFILWDRNVSFRATTVMYESKYLYLKNETLGKLFSKIIFGAI